MKQFAAPFEYLGDVEPGAVARLAEAAADIALVIGDDEQGTIRDMALGNEELARDMDRSWVGKSFSEVVTSETRGKVRELLDRKSVV